MGLLEALQFAWTGVKHLKDPKLALIALIAALLIFGAGAKSGYYLKDLQVKAAIADQQEEDINEHNEDAIASRQAEQETKEKIIYVDRIKWKYSTQTVQADCPDFVNELVGVFINPTVKETNSIILNSDL